MVVKYAVSGVIAFGMDFVCFVVLRYAGLALVIANPAARLLGAVTAFLLNRHWTFRRVNPRNWQREALAYTLLWCFSTLASTGAINFLTSSGPAALEPAYKLISEGLITSINYLIARHLIFR